MSLLSLPNFARFLTRKRLFCLGVGLFLFYAVIIFCLLALEDQFVFRPTAASEQWQPPPANWEVVDVYVHTKNGCTIHGWWCPGKNTQGAALICHGNGRNVSTIGEAVPEKLAQWHSQIGVSVLIFDYPGYGKSGGTPSEQGCYDAAEAALEWLMGEQGYASSEILLVGRSLGSAVAVDLASRHPHRALVLLCPFTSIPDVAEACYPLVPARLLMRNRFDSFAKIKSCTQPLLIFHGTHDSRVPFHLGKRLFDQANEPKRFIRVEGAEHGSSLEVDFFPEVKKFLADSK